MLKYIYIINIFNYILTILYLIYINKEIFISNCMQYIYIFLLLKKNGIFKILYIIQYP